MTQFAGRTNTMKNLAKIILLTGALVTCAFAGTTDTASTQGITKPVPATTQTPSTTDKKYTTSVKPSTTSTNWSKVKDLFL